MRRCSLHMVRVSAPEGRSFAHPLGTGLALLRYAGFADCASVDALRGRLPLAIASNTGEALVRLALQRTGLLEAFTVIVSGFDLGRSKPDPMVYRVACEALRVTPGEAAAFEDSPAGVASARAAGLFVVGVPDRPGVDLRAAGADRVVGSLADVVVRS